MGQAQADQSEAGYSLSETSRRLSHRQNCEMTQTSANVAVCDDSSTSQTDDHRVAGDLNSTHAGTSINESGQGLDGDLDDTYDNDSAIGNESLLDMDTESLQSDIKRHCYENGRRYHSYHDGAYWGPNDEIQNDENDISHHLWRLTLDDRLSLAPIAEYPQASEGLKHHQRPESDL